MRNEAITFGKYLLSGDTPDEKSIALYEAAHAHRNLSASATEEKLFSFAVKNQWALGAIDGALAFRNPDHIVRRKLLLMSAILESRPQYAELFIPEKRSFFYIFAFGWIGFRAVCKALCGRVIIALAG